jgi:predicted ferric reductase
MLKKRPLFIYFGLLIAALVPVIIGWWAGNYPDLSASGARLIAIGRLLGLISAFAILLEILLISRLPFIEKYFDLHDKNDLHRLNGYLILATFVGHIVFLTIGYSLPFKIGIVDQFWQLNQGSWPVLLATIGTIIFIFTIILSVRLIRKNLKYELWYLPHLLIYGAILATFIHQITDGQDFITQTWFKMYWIALFVLVFGVVLVFRFIRPAINYLRFRFKIEQITKEASDIYSVIITGRNLQKFKFEAGQYANFWFLSKSTWWENHAYSFSCPPGKNRLRITIKTTGDFGKKVPHFKTDMPVVIDGPRGAFTASRAISDNIILIAGGIGIAPYLSTISALLASGKNVKLYYAAHDDSQIAFKRELQALQNAGLKVIIFNSSQGNRINEEALNTCVKDNTDVFICGPTNMTEQFCQTLTKCRLCKKRIIAERFSM